MKEVFVIVREFSDSNSYENGFELVAACNSYPFAETQVKKLEASSPCFHYTVHSVICI